MEQIKINMRPFEQDVIKEIDRVAFQYRALFGEKAKSVCTRLLTGLHRCHWECTTCVMMSKPLEQTCKFSPYTTVLRSISKIIITINK